MTSPQRSAPALTVAIVTHNDAADLAACLPSLERQSFQEFELIVVDCASSDASLEIARQVAPAGIPIQLVDLGRNAGFAGGMNEAFRRSRTPYFLTLNADVELEPDCLETMVRSAERWASLPVGAVTPRLVRPGTPTRLDACGFSWTWTWRHLDRGSGELDRGQYQERELVFGGTGAATLLVRRAVEDVAVEPDQVFDPRFHTFREDAELAWRLNARGWRTLYEPAARGTHRRSVLPERRRSLPALANLNSLRNRYLLRIFHQSLPNFLWTLPWTLTRDIGALFWVLAWERTSLPAYRWLWQHRRALLAHRKQLQTRRTEPLRRLERWFLRRSIPLPDFSP